MGRSVFQSGRLAASAGAYNSPSNVGRACMWFFNLIHVNCFFAIQLINLSECVIFFIYKSIYSFDENKHFIMFDTRMVFAYIMFNAV